MRVLVQRMGSANDRRRSVAESRCFAPGGVRGVGRRRRGSLTKMYEYRYQVTRNGHKVGWAEAEFHGVAIWEVNHPEFVDPANHGPWSTSTKQCTRAASR